MKIILVDGNSLMFRSYYATAYTGNLMKNSSGLFTNAIFGFCNMITKLKEEEYDYIFVAFDAGKHTFRHRAYKDYKGGRKAMPEEFKVQIPYIKKYLDLLNIKHVEMDEFEADDLIASVSDMAVKNGIEEIKVVSGDKDLLQLVRKNVHVTLTKKGITDLDDYTVDNFYEKMGFNPTQVPDYKGLVGDSSDNLPGIKGIGEKTALKLLSEYETLENVINHIDELKGKTKDLIIEGQETGLKCKYFATLKYDIDLDFTLEDLKKKDVNTKDLIEFYKELEFKSFLKKLDNSIGVEEEKEVKKISIDLDYEIIDDVYYDFDNLGDRYLVAEVFGNNYYNQELLGIALYSSENNLFSQNIFVTKNVILNSESFKKYLLSSSLKKTFDYKKLYLVLKKNGIEIKNVCFDLLLAAYLINPKYASDDFFEVVSHFYSFDLLSDKDVYGQNSKMAVGAVEDYSLNALKKAYAIAYLEEELNNLLKENDLNKLYLMEIKLSEVLADIEINGLLIDVDKLKSVGMVFEEKMNLVQEEIYQLAGERFNINSVKQLGEILFEKLQLPVSKKNKTGFSTSVEVLEGLAPKYEIAKKILEYRTYSKLISTYVKGLIEVMDKNDYIHPIYKQALTMTGRLSSVEPNIQNMPIRTEEGQIIRDVFVSRFKDGLIMSVDYSQIELRVLAHMASDEAMINSFNSGEDFHASTASYIFGVDINDVTKAMRRCAKAINFGIVYGMSAWGLSESISISPRDAQAYINKYFEKHYKIDEFLKEVINNAKKTGYTKTMFNRLRYIPELASMNRNLYNFGERTAMNAPIQGSAADIIKFAMVEIQNKMKALNVKSLMIAQVHDELVFDVDASEKELMKQLVKETMENVVELKVDLIASVSIGETWLKS